MRITNKLLALCAGASLAVVGCSNGATADTGEDLQEVTIRTDYLFNGYVTPYALAIDNGYFEEEGLEVNLELGQGSSTTVQTVASGQDDFGIADAGTVVKAKTNEDIPVKILSVHLQKIPMGFVHRPEHPVDSPKDLQEREIIGSAGTAELSLLSGVVEPAGISTSDLNLQMVGAESRIPQFLSDESAALLAFATGDYLRAKAQDADVEYTSYDEFGLSAYGTGLVTHDDTVENDAELVEKVVRAVQRGWEAAIEDPEAAVEAGLKIDPGADEDLLLESLKISIDELLHTDNTEGQPLGWTAEEDWHEMLSLFHEYADMERPRDVSDYYTNEFIPEL